MKPRLLAWTLSGWALATAVLCVVVHRVFSLEIDTERPRAVVASAWSGGALVGRAILARADDRDEALEAVLSSTPDATLVHESVVAEGPILARPEAALSLSLVPGRDGVVATLDGRTEYATADDLLSRQAYDKGVRLPGLGLTLGIDVPLVLALLSERFGTSVSDLGRRATLRRARFVRTLPGAAPPREVTAASMTEEDVRAAAVAAARFLARGVDGDGRFRYLVDAPTNRTLPGYDLPRHAAATYFLAQAARLSPGSDIGWAALRAASWLRDRARAACGDSRCVADSPVADLGSTAFAVLAFVEIAGAELDPGYALLVPELTAFLRAQQRPDGEFMHRYDRGASRPIDVQFLYFSGEAAFALARANALLHDPRDLLAARRGLEHLVGPAWDFFGSRYYFGEEHWTCQAMAELWDRAPDAGALDFCLRWQAFGRALQYGPAETAFDSDGAYGVGPVVTPRLTPVASRCEAGIVTLDVAARAGVSLEERSRLEGQMRRSLALLLRHQFRLEASSPRHLLVDPSAVDGAVPATEVDWQLRIDFAQHAGSAWGAWSRRGNG